MLGVGTADGGVDHAYLYGCVLEASRATEAAMRSELRSQRVGAAGAAAGGAATAAGDDDVDDVIVDDDGEEEGRAAAATGGIGQPQQSSGASASSAPLRRLHSVLRTMINVEFLRADEDTLQVRGAPRSWRMHAPLQFLFAPTRARPLRAR